METLKFKAIINGPKEIIPNGTKVEDFEITEQDVLEAIEEEEESSEDVINYIKQDYIDAWEQHFCKVTLISLDDFNRLTK
jgi:hypothetical protein